MKLLLQLFAQFYTQENVFETEVQPMHSITVCTCYRQVCLWRTVLHNIARVHCTSEHQKVIPVFHSTVSRQSFMRFFMEKNMGIFRGGLIFVVFAVWLSSAKILTVKNSFIFSGYGSQCCQFDQWLHRELVNINPRIIPVIQLSTKIYIGSYVLQSVRFWWHCYITCLNPTLRRCFLPWYQITNSTQLINMLGEALTQVHLMCDLSPNQMQELPTYVTAFPALIKSATLTC